ncbi:hypothetical protein FMEAI12_3380021 [Parafrankia sp. Ea1.12]|nr:hypothetical protein FMEAI12_3380021 [Parafrankia sp. Ea1.12]
MSTRSLWPQCLRTVAPGITALPRRPRRRDRGVMARAQAGGTDSARTAPRPAPARPGAGFAAFTGPAATGIRCIARGRPSPYRAAGPICRTGLEVAGNTASVD